MRVCCSYLCARYCYELGRLEEAEAALLRGTGLEGRPVTQFTKAIMDDPRCVAAPARPGLTRRAALGLTRRA